MAGASRSGEGRSSRLGRGRLRTASVLVVGRRGALGLRLAAWALALALASAGCGAGRSTGSPLEGSAGESDEIEILVRNDNFSQVTVYTARSGAYRRLGIVPGKGESTFRTEWYLPDIQLRVRFLAGPDFFTERLPVSPGELLELIIPARD